MSSQNWRQDACATLVAHASSVVVDEASSFVVFGRGIFKQTLMAALALAGLCACSGCALVPFPVSRTLPDPVQQVEVVREDTGRPIADAEVVMHADRFKNWMRSFPPSCTADFSPATDTSVVIQLRQESPGHFTPERRRVWRYVRPWGVGPLGTTVHEDYTLTVSARSDGYVPVTATYWPVGDLNPAPLIAAHNAPVSFPRFGTNGTLTVFLRVRDVEPHNPASGSQTICSETNRTSATTRHAQ